MEYKGYDIQVSIYPDSNGGTFRATYTIACGSERVVTGTLAGGLKNVFDAEIRAYMAAHDWIDAKTPKSADTKESAVSLRTLNGSVAELLLTEARVAHTFLDVASNTSDETRRERNLQAAFDVLKSIDEHILKIEIDGQRQELILKARNSLAERLREFGRAFPNEK